MTATVKGIHWLIVINWDFWDYDLTELSHLELTSTLIK